MRKVLSILIVLLISLPFLGCACKSIERDLANQLKSDDVQERVEAARQLGEVATPEALRLLMIHKNDPDFRVKQEIDKSIKKIDSRTFLN